MKNTRQTILKKLANAPKKRVALKTRKVNLNAIESAREMADQAGGNYVYASEQMKEAHDQLMLVWDIMRFETPSIKDAEGELDLVREKLDELGIEYPESLRDAEASIEVAKERYNDVIKDMQFWGIDHGLDILF